MPKFLPLTNSADDKSDVDPATEAHRANGSARHIGSDAEVKTVDLV